MAPGFASGGRMIRVGSDGRLSSLTEDGAEIAADRLFAVVVVWDASEGWCGWLTTVEHRSLRFSPADLENDAFQRWLAGLPGWNPSSLANARMVRGIHLVWRRSGGM